MGKGDKKNKAGKPKKDKKGKKERALIAVPDLPDTDDATAAEGEDAAVPDEQEPCATFDGGEGESDQCSTCGFLRGEHADVEDTGTQWLVTLSCKHTAEVDGEPRIGGMMPCEQCAGRRKIKAASIITENDSSDPETVSDEEDAAEDDDDGSEPYGKNAIPEIVAAAEMGDDNFKLHLAGRHNDLLKGQNPKKMHNGAPLRPYYGAHMRQHNAGAGFDPHTHAEPEES